MKRILMLAAFAFIVDVYAEGMSFTKKIDDDLVEDDVLEERVDEEFSEELDILEGKSPKEVFLPLGRRSLPRYEKEHA